MRNILSFALAIAVAIFPTVASAALTISPDQLQPQAPRGITDTGGTATPRLHDTGDGMGVEPTDVRTVDSAGNYVAPGGGGGGGNTVAATNAGTSATTANPVQGVTGGVPVPVVNVAGSASLGTVGLNAGSQAIGSVTIGSPLPTGSNVIGGVTVNGSLPAGGNALGTVGITAGSALIGSVTLVPPTYAHADHSGAVTAGGTAQTVSAANTSRHGCEAQNLSTGAEYLRDDGTAASAGSGSIYLAPNAYYECPLSGASSTLYSLYGATTGQAFTFKDW